MLCPFLYTWYRKKQSIIYGVVGGKMFYEIYIIAPRHEIIYYRNICTTILKYASVIIIIIIHNI